MKQHQTTIIDIAKELNISKSTVSRALTGHPKVSAKTREAVLNLAEKRDYQRNMLAISLARSKSFTIGIVVPEFRTSFFPEVIIGAQELAASKNYSVVISQSNESYETEVANTKVMLANQVDGLLISITKETRNFDHLKIFQRKGIPIVFFNRVTYELQVPKVVVNDYEAAFAVVEHLIHTGRKRIAHLAGPDCLLISKNRLNGYRDALLKHQLPVAEELIIPYDLTIDKVKPCIEALLGLPEPPDALFAINDPTAIEAMLVIKSKGLRIPQDLSVVGFSNDLGASLIEPGLTTIDQPTHEIGRSAIKVLLDMMEVEPEKWKAFTMVLNAELIKRGSSDYRKP
jgi:DNA-binding LacI/PurR family transcriptional regulator